MIGLFLILSHTANAQILWLKSDEGVNCTTDNCAVSNWADQTGTNTDFIAANGPTLDTTNSAFNFNPSIEFTGTSHFAGPSGFSDFDNGVTIFAVGEFSDAAYYARILDFGNADQSDNVLLARVATTTSLRYEIYKGSTPAPVTWTNQITLNQPYLFSIEQLPTTGAATAYSGGASLGSQTTNDPNNILRTKNYIGRSNWSNDAYFQGKMAEIIMFNSTISSAQRLSIQSYLALKYGMTLDSSVSDYIRNGTNLYSFDGTYDYDIAGIGQDNDLQQRISKSNNASSILTVSTISNITLANTDNSRTALPQNHYVVWGHNNAAAGAVQTAELDTNVYTQRLAREWKIQKTGTDDIDLFFNFEQLPTLGTGQSYKLLYSTTGDFSSNTTELNTQSTTSSQFQNVNIPNGTGYITVAVNNTAQTIYCPTGTTSTGSGYASSGTGLHKDSIFWLDWSCGGQTFPANATVIKSWTDGEGLSITGQISNISHALNAYVVGTNSGDRLNVLYGGLNPIGITPDASAVTAIFDVNFSAAYNGAYISPNLVVAEAQDTGDSTESVTATTNGAGWQLIDRNGVIDVTFSNANKTIFLDEDPNTGRGSAVFHSANASQLELELEGGGRSAAAIGFFITKDRGDAPASYGTSAAHFLTSTVSGATQGVTDTSVNSMTLASISTNTNYHIGSSQPDSDAATIGNSSANGDDNDNIDDETLTMPSLYRDISSYLDVPVSGSNGYLQGFADWDGDGNFTTAGDQFATNIQDGGAGDLDNTVNGTIRLSIRPPANATLSPTFIRFRWSSISNLTSTSLANDGELEDYQITIGDTSSTPYTCATQNVALSGTPSMSSNFSPGDVFYQISNVNDGVKDTSQATTVSENQPWITLDLGQNYDIASLNVRGRATHLHRFTGFYAFTSVSPFPDTGNLVTDFTDTLNDSTVIKFQSPTGVTPALETLIPVNSQARYIRFQLPASDYLEISELEVNACYTPITADRGDAPASYGDPHHLSGASFHLGATAPDLETTTPHGTAADGDGADEDLSIPSLFQNTSSFISIPVTGSNGYLQVFADWNADGDFTTGGDQIATNYQDGGFGDADGSANGSIQMMIRPPATASTSQTYLRFRWSSQTGLNAVDSANEGEVEDHAITIGSNNSGQYSCSTQNIAPSGTPSMSSKYTANDQTFIATVINDGQYDVATYTSVEDGAWVDLDLGQTYDVANLTVRGRVSYLYRLTEFYAFTSLSPFPTTSDTALARTTTLNDPNVIKFQSPTGVTPDLETTVPVNGLVRYIRIQLAIADRIEISELTVNACDSPITADRGDAPASYADPTHIIDANYYIGSAAPDTDAAAAPGTNADNDDADGNDDDDTTIPSLYQNVPSFIDVAVSGTGGYLQAFADWAADGDFTTAGDHFAVDYQDGGTGDVDGTANGVIRFAIQPPGTASSSQTYLRLRWSSTASIDSVVAASNGEVEDYAITVATPTTITCPAGSTSTGSGYAASGTGQYKNEIFWLDWSCGSQTISAGDIITKTWNDGNGLTITGQINTLSFDLEPYTTGDWAGDSLDDLYSGLNPIGLRNVTAGQNASFVIDFTASLNGVSINPDIVIADAEDTSNTHESLDVTTNGQSWQILESSGSIDATFFNAAKTISMNEFANVSGGTIVALSKNTSSLVVDLTGGKTAVGIGIFIPRDFGDAPSSYGNASHLTPFTASGGSQPTTKTNNTSLTNAILTNTDTFHIGSSAADHDVSSQSNAAADGDDTNGSDDEALTLPKFFQGNSSYINVPVTGTDGYLQVFADWDADGNFTTGGDQIGVDYQDGGAGDVDETVDGTIRIAVRPPANASAATYLRLRWSPTSGINATDSISGGEVEDYAIAIIAQTVPSATCSVYNNNAMSGTATQSSNFSTTGSHAPIAIDGDHTGTDAVNADFTTLTGSQLHPWWTVDLGSVQSIDNITVWNRQSCCENRLGGFHLFVSDTAFPDTGDLAADLDSIINDTNVKRHQNSDTTPPHENVIPFNTTGRYVRVQWSHRDYMNLAEVEVNSCANVDRGDAPISYGDAAHRKNGGFYLGSSIPDTDATTLYSANADGDDTAGYDDEATIIPTLYQDINSYINVQVFGGSGYLQAFADWDGDGNFTSEGDQIATDYQDGGTGDLDNTVNGTIRLAIRPPANATTSQTFLRLRWSNVSGVDAIASGADGEVEDYAITINPITSNASLCSATSNVALTGTATQSSTYSTGSPASDAIDGDANGNTTQSSSQSHTNNELHAWWTVDLGSIQNIESVNIWNRTDACCDQRMNGVHLFVSQTAFPNTSNLSADIDTIIQDTSNFKYQYPSGTYPAPNVLVNVNTAGRYVRVQLPRYSLINMAEVQVNACAGSDRGDAPASYGDPTHMIQAGFYIGSSLPDINPSTVYSAGADGDDNNGSDDEILTIPTIFETMSSYINVPVSGTNGYLQVFADWDADGSFDTNGDQIYADLQDGASGDIDKVANGIIRIAVRPPAGANAASFLRLRWSGTAGLDATSSASNGEVQDYAYTPIAKISSNLPACSAYTNVARGGLATQSSNYHGSLYHASNGNDGATYSFVNTHGSSHEWWSIDLGSIQQIDDILVHIRDGCCLTSFVGYHLFVSDTPFPDTGNYGADLDSILETTAIHKEQYASSTPPRSTTTIFNKTGRYVRIQLAAKNYLAIGELKVNVCGTPDRGDAPSSYGEPLHFFDADYYIGNNAPDTETTAVHNSAADGDDTAVSADEGNEPIVNLLAGSSASYTVDVAGSGGYLQAWLDINNDGDFDDAGEQIATDIQDNGAGDLANVTSGKIKFSIPNTITAMNTYLRLRWSSVAGLNPIMAAQDGEVEDYALTIDPAAPFTCNSDLYVLVKTAENTMNLYTQNLSSGTSSMTNLATYSGDFNNIGYNTADNYLYTVDKDTQYLSRIAANGQSYPVGFIDGLPDLNYSAGDFSTPDTYFISSSNSTLLYSISTPTASLSASGSFSYDNTTDIAIPPSSLYAYGINKQGRPIRLPLDMSAPTNFGPDHDKIFSSAFADAAGIVYVSEKNSHDVFRLNITDGSLTLVATGPSSPPPIGGDDGAFCKTAYFAGTQNVNLLASKSVEIYDPSGDGLYSLPGNDVNHSVTVTNTGSGNADLDSIKLIDKIEAENIFYNGDYDDGGSGTTPVKFTDNNSGLTLTYNTDIAYSDSNTQPSSFAGCTYTPAVGYDPDVHYICINPKGAMNSDDPNPSFTISYRAKIK